MVRILPLDVVRRSCFRSRDPCFKGEHLFLLAMLSANGTNRYYNDKSEMLLVLIWCRVFNHFSTDIKLPLFSFSINNYPDIVRMISSLWYIKFIYLSGVLDWRRRLIILELSWIYITINSNSNPSSISSLRNSLPSICIPVNCNPQKFKCNVSRYLLSSWLVFLCYRSLEMLLFSNFSISCNILCLSVSPALLGANLLK